MAGVLPWSWTTFQDYRTCPKRYYEVRIAKSCREPDSPHLIWGNKVHSAFEHGVRDNIPMPSDRTDLEPIRLQLRAAPGVKLAEVSNGVTMELKPCGFWDKDCWSRGKDDLIIINGVKALSIDYKTGKPSPATHQLALSAARTFAHHPELTEITTAYFFTPTKQWVRAKYYPSDVIGIWEDIQDGVQQMLWSEKHNAWPAKPSGLCKRGKKPGSTYAGCPVTNCPHSENFRKP